MPTSTIQRTPRPSGASLLLLAGAALAAVGLARAPQGGGNNNNQGQTTAVPMLAGGTTADSNNRMVAVTGIDVTGASILFLVDTERRHLAVYQASGAGSNQGVRFVGARNIELDLELDGYNDKSDYSFKRLREEFAKQGGTPGAPGVQVPPPGGGNDR